MKPVFDAIAGTTAMLIIAAFWISTLVSELLLDHAAIVVVKHSIVAYGMVVLVLMMGSLGRVRLRAGEGAQRPVRGGVNMLRIWQVESASHFDFWIDG